MIIGAVKRGEKTLENPVSFAKNAKFHFMQI